MSEPRELVAQIEASPRLPDGDGERFNGWGVFGLTFASGHILALRRFPASSIGPAYTSVWHRDERERWTMYTTVEPMLACPRFYGSAVSEAIVTPIDLTWTGPRALSIATGNGEVAWAVTMAPTPATRMLNAMGGVIPDALWSKGAVLSLIGGTAGLALRAGRIGLHGNAPNGQAFVANPVLIWSIPSSQAVVRGAPLGPVGPLREQARLADFWLPQRGLFVTGMTFVEPLDPARHRAVPTIARIERRAPLTDRLGETVPAEDGQR